MTILVPRGFEAAAVRRARTGRRVAEIAPGQATAGTLPGFAPSELVVVLGLCGALHDHHVGEIVIYRSVADERGPFALDGALASACAAALAAQTTAARIVAACTADHVVTTLGERRALRERYAADVVDMEGSHLAAALAARGVRCAMVRAVSDDASRDLPALEGAIRADGRLDGARIALAFARAPRGAARFVRDVSSALASLTRAARVLAGSDSLDATS